MEELVSGIALQGLSLVGGIGGGVQVLDIVNVPVITLTP